MNPWFLHLSEVRKTLSEEQKKELGVAGIAKLAKKTYKREPQKENDKSSKKKKKGTKSSKKKKGTKSSKKKKAKSSKKRKRK